MTDAERLEECQLNHVRDHGEFFFRCHECHHHWPCDAAVALAEVERLRGVVEAASVAC